MTMDWDLAVAVSRGQESGQRAFLDGRLMMAGDPVILLGHQAHLIEVGDVLAQLRSRTFYGQQETGPGPAPGAHDPGGDEVRGRRPRTVH
jgi:hypothetical protein